MTDTAPPAPQTLRPPSTEALWQHLSTPHPQVGKARHLGEALLHSGLISLATLRHVLQAQKEGLEHHQHRQLGQILVDEGHLSQEQLSQVIAAWLGDYTIDPTDLPPDGAATALIPRAVAERESVLPLLARDDALVVLMTDPGDKVLLNELRFLTQRRILPLKAAPGTLLPALQRAYAGETIQQATPKASAQQLVSDLAGSGIEGDTDTTDVVSESDNTLVRLINSLINEAIHHRASDIHIETEPAPRSVHVRLRVDGDLIPYLELPARYRFAMVARIKIMADMDISEHRKPQDGKIDFSRFGGPKIELRVVTVPTSHGLEDVVLRLLAGAKPLPLEQIGLRPANITTLRTLVQKTYGLILVVGPTGCGKTTTLHSVMRDINTPGRKIWTAEDPIEISQAGLRQVQVNARIGWTFAAAMRTFLRADPDVIMIGEMRDEETARIAVEASLTGHLVLSTLHTNSAPESVARLLEIGIDPFNFSDSLLGILAQRLVRRLCTACRKDYTASPDELDALAAHYLDVTGPHTAENRGALVARWRQQYGRPDGEVALWRRVGCPDCENVGYHGRLGIHELMLTDDTIRLQIRRRAAASEVREHALQAGMLTLRQDGIEKVLQGLTDMAEVLAATNL